jgi:hypothetical protein
MSQDRRTMAALVRLWNSHYDPPRQSGIGPAQTLATGSPRRVDAVPRLNAIRTPAARPAFPEPANASKKGKARAATASPSRL